VPRNEQISHFFDPPPPLCLPITQECLLGASIFDQWRRGPAGNLWELDRMGRNADYPKRRLCFWPEFAPIRCNLRVFIVLRLLASNNPFPDASDVVSRNRDFFDGLLVDSARAGGALAFSGDCGDIRPKTFSFWIRSKGTTAYANLSISAPGDGRTVVLSALPHRDGPRCPGGSESPAVNNPLV
jgi:hypothetical protein